MAKEADMELFTTTKEGNIVVIGKIIKCMEKERYTTLTGELPIKETGAMIPSLEKESFITKIQPN